MGLDFNKSQRLREYGMYIRSTRDGQYNLGWTQSQRRGGLAKFPTYDDAYDAFEQIVNRFWEYHEENFQVHAEGMLHRVCP